MTGKKLFLQWLLIAVLMGIATVIGIILHIPRWIMERDPTFISFCTIALCWAATLYGGPSALRIGATIARPDSIRDLSGLPELYARIKNAKFAANLCPFLGLLGTIVGLIQALENFKRAGAVVNQEAMHQILVNLGTALVTTEVGMVCGALLWLQYHLVETDLETYEALYDPKAQ